MPTRENIYASFRPQPRLGNRPRRFLSPFSYLLTPAEPLQATAPRLNWVSVASSSDGMKFVAADGDYDGHVYTSVDSGATWTQRL